MSRRPDLPPEIQHRASRIRGVGYAIAGAAVLFIGFCLVSSVLDGLGKGLARDPITGARVAELDVACSEWAEQLVAVDATGEARSAAYEVQVVSWRWRCGHGDDAATRTLREREPRYRLR